MKEIHDFLQRTRPFMKSERDTKLHNLWVWLQFLGLSFYMAGVIFAAEAEWMHCVMCLGPGIVFDNLAKLVKPSF